MADYQLQWTKWVESGSLNIELIKKWFEERGYPYDRSAGIKSLVAGTIEIAKRQGRSFNEDAVAKELEEYVDAQGGVISFDDADKIIEKACE
ncbi:MAG: hypothetical protein WAN56_05065 [Halobacteriota archaeon]